MADDAVSFPEDSDGEKELLLQWLGYLRSAVRRDLEGIDDEGGGGPQTAR